MAKASCLSFYGRLFYILLINSEWWCDAEFSLLRSRSRSSSVVPGSKMWMNWSRRHQIHASVAWFIVTYTFYGFFLFSSSISSMTAQGKHKIYFRPTFLIFFSLSVTSGNSEREINLRVQLMLSGENQKHWVHNYKHLVRRIIEITRHCEVINRRINGSNSFLLISRIGIAMFCEFSVLDFTASRQPILRIIHLKACEELHHLNAFFEVLLSQWKAFKKLYLKSFLTSVVLSY